MEEYWKQRGMSPTGGNSKGVPSSQQAGSQQARGYTGGAIGVSVSVVGSGGANWIKPPSTNSFTGTSQLGGKGLISVINGNKPRNMPPSGFQRANGSVGGGLSSGGPFAGVSNVNPGDTNIGKGLFFDKGGAD
jgi:hypothetical protein